jgi:dTDP-glucose 4,6-dehydratase
MRVLVTGGLGFIGSNFVEHILAVRKDVEVLNLDKCDYMAREHNVAPQARYKFIKADITERYHMEHIFKEHQPEVVIHFAAQSCVDRSFDLSFQFTKDNVLGTHVLLDTVRTYGRLQKFIHISTDEVYGEVGPLTTSDEKSPLNPSNPYSASKAAAELYVRAYGTSYNVPFIITRGNNVFGPKQYPEKVIPLFITQILKGLPCTVHGDGGTRRNFVHVDDVSKAVEAILYRGEIGKMYNIGSAFEFSVNEILDKLRNIIGPHVRAKHIADPRPHNDSRYCIDSSALRALGWSEHADFDADLRRTVQWYQDNKTWFDGHTDATLV